MHREDGEGGGEKKKNRNFFTAFNQWRPSKAKH